MYKWPGHGARPGASKFGQIVFLEGRLARGDRFEGQNYNAGTDYELMTLPVGLRPSTERRFVVKMSSYDASRTASVTVQSDGLVIARPGATQEWIGLDGISFTLAR